MQEPCQTVPGIPDIPDSREAPMDINGLGNQEEEEKRRRNTWRKFNAVFPTIMLGYALLMGAAGMKVVMAKEKEEGAEIMEAEYSQEVQLSAYETYSYGKSIGGSAPLIESIKYDEGVAIITSQNATAAIVEVNPMAIGEYRGPGYVRVESEGGTIRISLKEIREETASYTSGFLQEALPGMVYVVTEGDGTISKPSVFSILRNRSGGIRLFAHE